MFSFKKNAATVVLVWTSGTPRLWFSRCAVSLGVVGQLLQQRVGFALGSFDTVSPHDAGGPMEIQHHHQLLPLLTELLDLGLELRVHHLQAL